MVAVAQLVRASDCDSEGRGFEPLQLPKAPEISGAFYLHLLSTIEILFNHFIIVTYLV